MNRITSLLILGLFFLLPFTTQAQGSVAADVAISVAGDKGKTFQVQIEVQPKDGWHVYSAQPSEEMAYNPTSINYDATSSGFEAGESLSEEGDLHSKYDDLMGGELRFYEDKVVFTQEITLKADQVTLLGSFDYMACNDVKCVMFSEKIEKALKAK